MPDRPPADTCQHTATQIAEEVADVAIGRGLKASESVQHRHAVTLADQNVAHGVVAVGQRNGKVLWQVSTWATLAILPVSPVKKSACPT